VNRRYLALALLAGAALATPARAQSGDANAGRNLAAACANCHGTNGRSLDGMPALAGMSSDRLARIMSEFRSRARPATVMNQIARGYTDEQIRHIADYFSAQAAK